MITCPICKVGLLNPANEGLSIKCNNEQCGTVWELTRHEDFVNTNNKEDINELDQPLKNNITGNINLPKISNRTLVLVYIHEWQKKTGEGIGFLKLVEIMKREQGMSRSLVSKCQDSLWDSHLITDKMQLKDGFWSKAILIEPDAKLFVEKISKDLNLEMNL
jgi:hypothetical protein